MMNRDKFNNFIQFFINYLLMLIVFVFLLIMCGIIFATTSHAEDPSYFPMEQDENDLIPTNIENYIANHYDEDYYYFCYYEKKEENSWAPGHYYYYFRLIGYNQGQINPLFGEIQSDGYHFSLYSITSSQLTYRRLSFYDTTPNNITDSNNGSLSSFANLVSSKYTQGRSYISNFRLMTNNSDNAEIVLRFGPDPIPPLDIGSAIIPPSPFLPEYVTGDTPPNQVPPAYTPNDYQWTTPPTFDGSTVTNAIGSIQNLLGWIANNLKEEFKNITDNGKHFFEYIGKTIQYYGNAILSTLNNFIQNFYDNMAALVQPIYEKISYITEPIDSDSISSAFNQNGLVSVKNDFVDFFNDFDDIIRNTPDPETFDIIINVQNVQTFYNFGVRSPVVLHLGNNLNGTLKTTFQAFLWVLVIVGSIFLTEKNLSAWIKGGGFSDK